MNNRYTHLTGEERAVIQVSLEQGASVRAIARTLARNPSTISRELTRNGWRNPKAGPPRRGRPPVAGGYRARCAQRRADQRVHRPRRQRRLAPGTPAWDPVVSLLHARHSPEQVSAIVARMQPHNRVSHETIYTALYALPQGDLRRALIGCLRQHRKRRRPRSRAPSAG